MYVAKQSVGEFLPDQEVTGLDDSDIERLLSIGAIEEVESDSVAKEPKAPKAPKK
jgi:hypothetical protein